jgi:dihydroorotate dehydrogenase
MFFINPPFGNYISLPGLTQIKGSFTLEPRDGLIYQIVKTLRYSFYYKDWINKIGLRNKGLDYAIKNYKKGEIISIAIMNKEEIPKIIKKIPMNMDIELNVSCPNVEKKNERLELEKFINPERKWCIIKLSPICNKNLIDDYYNHGFRQFHCSNTIPIPEGGLSGSALIPYNRNLIGYIKSKYNDVEIIGGGGIKRWENVEQYKKMGADHFAFSTVAFCPYLFRKLYMNISKNIIK